MTAENRFVRGLLAMTAIFAVLFMCAVYMLDYMNNASEEAQLEMVERAVMDAAITCYAIEGAYPKELQYLIANYGLYYDNEHFVVFYDSFASNVSPDVRVRLKGGTAHE